MQLLWARKNDRRTGSTSRFIWQSPIAMGRNDSNVKRSPSLSRRQFKMNYANKKLIVKLLPTHSQLENQTMPLITWGICIRDSALPPSPGFPIFCLRPPTRSSSSSLLIYRYAQVITCLPKNWARGKSFMKRSCRLSFLLSSRVFDVLFFFQSCLKKNRHFRNASSFDRKEPSLA